jgi:hypothetical protein
MQIRNKIKQHQNFIWSELTSQPNNNRSINSNWNLSLNQILTSSSLMVM